MLQLRCVECNELLRDLDIEIARREGGGHDARADFRSSQTGMERVLCATDATGLGGLKKRRCNSVSYPPADRPLVASLQGPI
jgi:hypothetical protein